MNQKKILQCKTIIELESIFENLFKKTYNHEHFLETVKVNLEKYFKMNSRLEQFFNLNEHNSWDIKRREISENLSMHFSPIEKENLNFVNELSKLNFSFNRNFIENYEEILDKEFPTLRKLYSKKDLSTPTINHDEINNNDLSGKNFKLAICISDFKFFSDDLLNSKTNNNSPNQINEDIFWVYFTFTEEKLAQNYEFVPGPKDQRIKLQGLLANKHNFEIYHFDFTEGYPAYLNVFLFYSKKNIFIGSYRYEIANREISKVETIYSENLNKNSYSLLEIKLMKCFTNNISELDIDLEKLLFRPPRYLYNFKIDNIVDETDFNEKDPVQIKEFSLHFNKQIENDFTNTLSNEKSFLKENLIMNNLNFELNEQLEKKYNYFKKTTNQINNDNIFKAFVSKYLKSNKSTPVESNNSVALNNINASGAIQPENLAFSNVNSQIKNILEILIENKNSSENQFSAETHKDNFSTRRPNIETEPDPFSFRFTTRLGLNNNLNNTPDKNHAIENILNNWISKNDTSFEEILYSLVLIDSNSITIYEKLHLLYQIGKMRNYALCRKDDLSLKKLKEIIYSLYKRFMINFNKSEIDAMIDYLLKKEEYACLRFAYVYKKQDDSRIDSIVDEINYEPKESILTMLNFKQRSDLCEDLKIHLQNYYNLLKNNFLMERISLNHLNTIWELSYPKILKKMKISQNQISEKWKYDQIKIDFCSDNIRKKINLEINVANKNTFKIINKEISERCIKKLNTQGVKKIMENLIFEDLLSVNLSNVNSDDTVNVSFDQFKDVFFNLPFISEFIRACSGFTEHKIEASNKKLDLIKVHLNVRNSKRYFSFSEGNVSEDYYN